MQAQGFPVQKGEASKRPASGKAPTTRTRGFQAPQRVKVREGVLLIEPTAAVKRGPLGYECFLGGRPFAAGRHFATPFDAWNHLSVFILQNRLHTSQLL